MNSRFCSFLSLSGLIFAFERVQVQEILNCQSEVGCRLLNQVGSEHEDPFKEHQRRQLVDCRLSHLGLVRDVLFFAALGTGVWSSAFILAFTIPNLFRRLLGEGAITSALVPVFTDSLAKDGREGAFRFFNQLFTRLTLVLVGLVAAGAGALAGF